MNENALLQMKDIPITTGALELLARIFLSCLSGHENQKMSDFDPKNIKTLADLISICPIPVIDIYNFVSDYKDPIITPSEIVEVFAGKPHLRELANAANGSYLMSNGRPYQERLEKFGIGVGTSFNQAQFALIDMLTGATVTSTSGDQTDLVKQSTSSQEQIVIRNCYNPKETSVNPGEKVLTHFGIIIASTDQFDIQWLENILASQQEDEYFAKILEVLSGKTIDCHHICADPDNGLEGFNSTKWAKPRLN